MHFLVSWIKGRWVEANDYRGWDIKRRDAYKGMEVQPVAKPLIRPRR